MTSCGHGRSGLRPYMFVTNGLGWAGLNLNPHPLKSEGAAPDWHAGDDGSVSVGLRLRPFASLRIDKLLV